jgi:hypothetical protein
VPAVDSSIWIDHDAFFIDMSFCIASLNRSKEMEPRKHIVSDEDDDATMICKAEQEEPSMRRPTRWQKQKQKPAISSNQPNELSPDEPKPTIHPLIILCLLHPYRPLEKKPGLHAHIPRRDYRKYKTPLELVNLQLIKSLQHSSFDRRAGS